MKSTLQKLNQPKPTIQGHINNGLPKIQELSNILRNRIKKIDDSIHEYITKPYIGYKLTGNKTLFVEVHIQKKRIVLHLRPVDYYEAKLTIYKMPNSHKWTLNKLVDLNSLTDIDAVIELVKQSYYDVKTPAKV